MITNANITLYNKVTGQDSPEYIMTHIYDVNWQDEKQAKVGDKGLNTADSTNVFIPYSSIDVCKKKYVKPKLYQSYEDKSLVFTFQKGDILVLGIVNDDIKTDIEIKDKYDDVMTITSIQDQHNGSYRMNHFEIGVI